MRWSKVRKLVEDSFAESLRGRITVHSTRHGCGCGNARIEIDRRPVVNFDTHVSLDRFRAQYHEASNVSPRIASHPAIPDDERTEGVLAEPGEFSRQDFYMACWEYLHSSVNDSLASPNPLIASLAVLNARVGKQRLRRMLHAKLHPLTRALLEFRLQAEAEQSLARAG
jgi:hypothetical protein